MARRTSEGARLMAPRDSESRPAFGRGHGRRSPVGHAAAATALAAFVSLTSPADATEETYATRGTGTFGEGHGPDAGADAKGTATARYPLVIPPARGAPQPILGLHYTQGATRISEVGVGWSLGLPVIERRGLAGSAPLFTDEDVYYLSGERLVQICAVTANAGCDVAGTTLPMPHWAATAGPWTLYRPAVDSSYTRVFRSGDGQTWRVQKRSGEILEFGVAKIAPLATGSYGDGIDFRPTTTTPFRWRLVRQSEAFAGGANPKNIVVYAWRHWTPNDVATLEDIFYTPPVAGGIDDTAGYAHHVHFAYAPDTWRDLRRRVVFAPPWLSEPDRTVAAIEIASKGTGATRELVRRYHLEWTTILGRPHLRRVILEGRCPAPVYESLVNDGRREAMLLPAGPTCPLRPGSTVYSYTPSGYFTSPEGAYVGARAPVKILFVDANGAPMATPHLALNGIAMLDVNRDGLADLVQSDPPRVYINRDWSNEASAGVRVFQAQEMALTSPGSCFKKEGLTVVGAWSDLWGASWLFRAPGSVNVQDGGPTALFELRPTGTGWDFTQRGTVAIAPPPHLFGDVDSDGTVDKIYLDETTAVSPPPTKLSLGRRRANGAPPTVGYVQHVAGITNLQLRTGNLAPRFAALADMDGDGLADYVTERYPASSANEGMVFIPGRGNGMFGCDPSLATECVRAIGSPGFNASAPSNSLGEVWIGLTKPGENGGPPTSWPTNYYGAKVHDVTGDGRADWIEINPTANGYLASVFIGLDGLHMDMRGTEIALDGTTYHLGAELPPGSPAYRPNAFFGDVDGNGIDDVVVCGDTECAYIGYQEGKPGLLTRIEHEGGARTDFVYYPGLAQVEAEQRQGANPWPDDGAWRSHAPVAVWPVKQVTTHNDAPAPYSISTSTEFEYRDPVFDRWRGALRGFRRVRARSANRVTDTQYLFEGCLVEDVLAQQAGGCTSPELPTAADAYAGLPYLTEVSDASGSTFYSTTASTYTVQDGGDGTRFAYASRVDTYLYDTAAFVSSPSTAQYFTPGQAELTIPIRAGAAHLRRRQQYDARGNLTASWDDGQVDLAGAARDRPIKTVYTWEPEVGAVSALGHQYRLHRTSTVYDAGGSGSLLSAASGLDGPERRAFHEYDSLGRLHVTRVPVDGVLALERTHATLGAAGTAPEPATAAPELADQTTTLEYDGFGNVVTQRGASGECVTTEYDGAYADHPVTSTTWLNANCSGAHLMSSMRVDRAFGVVTQRTDPTGYEVRTELDELGRPKTSLERASGVAPGTPHTPVMTFTYSPDGPVHWMHAQRVAADPANATSTWTFIDSLGRSLATLTQADTSKGDGGDWVVHPAPVPNPVTGLPSEWHRPSFFTGPAETFAVGAPAGALSKWVVRDFMARPTQVFRGHDGGQIEQRAYHALETDVSDADNLAGYHLGMYVTLSFDGHGRQIKALKRRENGNDETTLQDYLATGELVVLERREALSGGAKYRRWLRYDSRGHVVENLEPNSTANYADAPSAEMKGWRYAYDLSGRLVGTRDARGCGKNLFYDLMGRLKAEDYSPCLDSHPAYTAPDLLTGDGTEALYRYDGTEPGQTTDYGGNPFALRGRLVSVRDRGAHTRMAYDGKGRVIGVAKRIAKPGAPSSALASRYTEHWFRTATAFDEVDRVSEITTGADVSQLMTITGAPSLASFLSFHYSRRGTVSSIDGSYGTLLQSQRFAADGAPEEKVFGDAVPAYAHYTYYDDRRLATYVLGQPAGPLGQPPDVISQRFEYDQVGNVLRIDDLRSAQSLPAGAKPVNTYLAYDANYRLESALFDHQGDSQTSPFHAEEQAGSARHLPRLALQSRAGVQLFNYDSIGNLIGVQDDQLTSFDRGLGTVTVGEQGAASASSRKPNQMLSSAGPIGYGATEAHYDAAGNLEDFAVEREGTCAGPTGKCTQRFVYEWDEIGQLSRARRWDYTDLTGQPLYPDQPAGPASVELAYQYSQGARVIKTAVDTAGGAATHAVEIFGTLRLDHAEYVAATNDFERNASTETAFLPGLGRVLFDATLPSSTGSGLHVLLNFGNHLGSSTAIVDKDSGALVEYTTYLPYGATESDYRPEAWHSHREDYRFTGKEEDVEVGLTYFGARYYSPYMGRFVSPDPLTVHALGADLNPYAYVSGRVFNATDPNGLNADGSDGCLGAEQCGGSADGGVLGAVIGGFIGAIATLFDSGSDSGGGSGNGAAAAPPPPPPPPPPSPGFFARGVEAASAARFGTDGAHLNAGNTWKATWNEAISMSRMVQATVGGPLGWAGMATQHAFGPPTTFDIVPDGDGDMSAYGPAAAGLVAGGIESGPALFKLARAGMTKIAARAAASPTTAGGLMSNIVGAGKSTATVVLHEGGHATVLSEVGDVALHTEQVVLQPTRLTTIAEVGAPKPVTNSVQLTLPNGPAAQGYQRSMLGRPTGIYNGANNNCLGHCANVLRAGGVEGVPNGPFDFLNWLRAQ